MCVWTCWISDFFNNIFSFWQLGKQIIQNFILLTAHLGLFSGISIVCVYSNHNISEKPSSSEKNKYIKEFKKKFQSKGNGLNAPYFKCVTSNVLRFDYKA